MEQILTDVPGPSPEEVSDSSPQTEQVPEQPEVAPTEQQEPVEEEEQRIPYSRFKEVNDKYKSTVEKIEKLNPVIKSLLQENPEVLNAILEEPERLASLMGKQKPVQAEEAIPDFSQISEDPVVVQLAENQYMMKKYYEKQDNELKRLNAQLAYREAIEQQNKIIEKEKEIVKKDPIIVAMNPKDREELFDEIYKFSANWTAQYGGVCPLNEAWNFIKATKNEGKLMQTAYKQVAAKKEATPLVSIPAQTKKTGRMTEEEAYQAALQELGIKI